MKNLDSNPIFWITARWPAPGTITAGTTTRLAGYSLPPYNGLNLATHVGDDPAKVLRNRRLVKKTLLLPDNPPWLQQTHGNRVVPAVTGEEKRSADGMFTDQSGIVCAVLTADCVPLLLCNTRGTEVAAIHVGWRGLTTGIIDNAMEKFTDARGEILAWTGPHIGAENYEIGAAVRDACITSIGAVALRAFVPTRAGHWYANMAQLVQMNLANLGVTKVYASGRCTFLEPEYFYSYRREGATGRMASLIWISP